MPDALRSSCRRLAAVLILLLQTAVGAQAGSPPAEIPLTEALVCGRVGGGGRAPFHADAIQAMIVAGEWQPPSAGDAIALPGGETIEWRKAQANDDGWVESDGLAPGYAFLSVDSPDARVATLHAVGHSAVYVNGELRAGDPYQYGSVRLPVALRQGSNEFLFACARGRVKATLLSPDRPVGFESVDRTLPDLIAGDGQPQPMGLVVANRTDSPVDGLIAIVSGGGLPTRETALPTIAPMTVRKVPVWFGGEAPDGVSSCRVRVELVQRSEGGREMLDSTDVELSVRRPGETHVRTFVSGIDGSVQYYAITPARPTEDGTRRPGLALSCHGASVEASGQARVYQSKDWIHVVAPTNRRPFGFDWEDWGRLDFLEVYDLAMRRLDPDPSRVYLTGHSMGGHGTWQLGATFPDRWGAIGPSAGWPSFWTYTGAAEFDADDPVEAILGRAANPSRTMELARNHLQHGVYILHGDADDNVPVEQARMMTEKLAGFHPDVAYHEQPGAGHWWGNQCCDWPPMFDYFKDHPRAADANVDSLEFRTANPGVSARSRWITIEAQRRALEFSGVKASWDGEAGRYVVETDNVERLAIEPVHAGAATAVGVEIDGRAFDGVRAGADGRIRFAFDAAANEWMPMSEPASSDQKGPHRAGPFKDVFRNRMIFVYGTRGTAEENAWAYAKARYDAETFWYRGNGAVDVVADVDFDAGAERDRNVILYGHAGMNAAWEPLLAESPVRVGRGTLVVGDESQEGDDLACLFILPRPGSDTACVGVVAGTGLTGLRLTDRLPYFVSGIHYPDWIVFGPETLTDRIDGVRGAGFFGNDWSVEAGDAAWRD